MAPPAALREFRFTFTIKLRTDCHRTVKRGGVCHKTMTMTLCLSEVGHVTHKHRMYTVDRTQSETHRIQLRTNFQKKLSEKIKLVSQTPINGN